jgi:hypothetical protein
VKAEPGLLPGWLFDSAVEAASPAACLPVNDFPAIPINQGMPLTDFERIYRRA